MKSLRIWEAAEEKKNPNESFGNLRDSHCIGTIWTKAALNESCPQMRCIPRGPTGFSGSHLRKKLLSNPGTAESIMVTEQLFIREQRVIRVLIQKVWALEPKTFLSEHTLHGELGLPHQTCQMPALPLG